MAGKSLLPDNWEVPGKVRRRLGAQAGRQRVIFEEGHLLLVLHKPSRPDQVAREAALFWRAPDGSWMSDQQGSGLGSLQELVRSFAIEIDHIEQVETTAKSADDYFNVLDRVAPIHRTAVHMYEVLQDARKTVPDDGDLINLRDISYDNSRRVDLLYNGAKISLDCTMARNAEKQANASHAMAAAAHRLNLLAAFFFPLVTLAAILGVNLKHGYEDLYAPWTFLVFVLCGLLGGLIMSAMLFNRSTNQQS